MRKRIELLAPAGSFEALKAAVANGADAVYLGGKNFGARAFAANFDHEQMKEAVRYAHLSHVRVYVTMNTLLNDIDLQNALKEVDFLYETGVDALLIQDLGLYYEVSRRYPDLELHASTQMHIHNLEGVRSAKKMGLRRIVAARETPLPLLKEMCREGIEIEAFVHGALCVSYSGQCLLSSSLKGRSGNKGVCAQCCRLPYGLYDEDAQKEIPLKEKYLLSTHDLCELQDVPELIKAGVASLKIEGRMKKPAYVGYITRQYRQAIDAFYAGENYVPDEETLENMKVLFNRGFTDTYLREGKAEELYAQSQPNHRGVLLGTVESVQGHRALIRLTKDLQQFDGIRFAGSEEGMILNRLYAAGKLVSSVKKGALAGIDIDFKVRKGEKVYKTSDSLLEASVALEGVYKRLPLDLSLQGAPGEPLTLSGSCDEVQVSVTAEAVLERSRNQQLDPQKVRSHLDHFRDTPYELRDLQLLLPEDTFLPVALLKELRRQFVEELNEQRLSRKRTPYTYPELPDLSVPALAGEITEYQEAAQKALHPSAFYASEDPEEGDYLLLPVIAPDSVYPEREKIIVSEPGGLFLQREHKIASYTLHCLNHSCLRFLDRLGFEAVICSSEIHDPEWESFAGEERVKRFVYGRRDLMNLKCSPLYAYPGEHLSLLSGKMHLPLQKKKHRFVLLEAMPYRAEGEGYRRYTVEKAD